MRLTGAMLYFNATPALWGHALRAVGLGCAGLPPVRRRLAAALAGLQERGADPAPGYGTERGPPTYRCSPRPRAPTADCSRPCAPVTTYTSYRRAAPRIPGRRP
ncbi:hypothetical protein [Streptomyces cinnamoneus]|uniref:hypothetical protein n=1 Tax=Streptomyces cinnamoneus TaxID=53446 RepID=UPI0015E33049|nr:hypothetical protein [Streptomyces cinnamoneus]